MKALLLLALLYFPTPALADFDTASDTYHNKDYTAAYKEFKQLAELGNKRAQFNLAVMHLRGDGIEKDLTEAFAWLTLAQDQGNPKYAKSLTKATNKLSAEQLLIAEKKAQLLLERFGSDVISIKLAPIAYAENELSNHSTRNYTIEPIVKTQPIWPTKLKRAGHQGWVTVEFDVYPDDSVRNIRVVDAFPDDALNKTTIKAVSKWRFKAFYNEGIEPYPAPVKQTVAYSFYDKNNNFKQIYTQILKTTKKRALNENPRSQYLYAIAANVSTFVDPENFIDKSEVNHWLFKSAQNGNPDGQYQLGRNILRGVGCKKDKQKGLFWITESAKNGNSLAAFMAYELLSSGGKTNNSIYTAEEWLKKSASAGNADAMIEWSRYTAASEAAAKKDLTLARKYLRASKKTRTKSVKWYIASADLYERDGNPSKASTEKSKALALAKKLGWETDIFIGES